MEISTDVNAVTKGRICRKRISPVVQQCVAVHPTGTDVFCKKDAMTLRDKRQCLSTTPESMTVEYMWTTFCFRWMRVILICITWICIIHTRRWIQTGDVLDSVNRIYLPGYI